MPKYKAKSKIWLSHENRMVEAGEIFETTFPKVGGKEMRLSDNLELIKPDKPVKSTAKNKEPDPTQPPEDDKTGDNGDENPENADDNSDDEEGEQ